MLEGTIIIWSVLFHLIELLKTMCVQTLFQSNDKVSGLLWFNNFFK